MKNLLIGIISGITICLFYYWNDKPYNIVENEINLKAIELFELNDNKAEVKSLEDKNTYFYFWGTYCAPCLDKLPKLNEIACKEGNTIVCISAEESETIQNYLDHFDYECLKFLRVNRKFSEFGIRLIPKMISFQTEEPKLLSKEEINLSTGQKTE